MASYYSRDSAQLVVTKSDVACGRPSIRISEVAQPGPCRGEITWVWVHSGYGDSEMPACEAWIEATVAAGVKASLRLSYGHAVARDAEGVWRLAPDAELI